MTLRVMIVDDEAPARVRIATLLGDVADRLPTTVVAEAANGPAALAHLATTAVDVMLTDIRMPGMSGLELAQHVAYLEQPPGVIFVTAFDDCAIQAFELNAVDYLLKPVRSERLLQALSKVKRQIPAPAVLRQADGGARLHLSITERGRLVLVPISQVVYLKAEQKYVTVRTQEREFLLEESLAQLELEFAERFVRIHRNCLIGRDHLLGFERGEGEDGEGWFALLQGIDERLPVSRRQAHLVKEFRRR